MKEIDDLEIIRRVKKGEINAFSAIVDKYKRMIYSIAFKILKNNESAEEAAQDAFLNAFRNLASFDSKSKFSTWLYKIAFNAAISKSRLKKENFAFADYDESEDYYDDFSVNDGANNLKREDQVKYVNIALNNLNEIEALIVNLYYYDDKTIEEISEITDLGKSNIKVILYRTRKKIYDSLNSVLKQEAESLL